MRKCLYNLKITDHLIDKRSLIRSGFTLNLEQLERLIRDNSCNNKRKRCERNYNYRNPEIQIKHEHKREKNRHYTRKKLSKSHQQSISKKIYICNYPAHHFSCLHFIKILKGQCLKLVKSFRPDISYNFKSNDIIRLIHHPLTNRSDHDCHKHPDKDRH